MVGVGLTRQSILERPHCFGVAWTPEFMAPTPIIKTLTTFNCNPIGSFASGRKGYSVSSLNKRGTANAECRGSMALPRGNSKTGTGKTLKLHYRYPLTHHRGLRGGHTDQVEVSVKEGRLGHLTFMSDSQG